jgi:hypothetical protein
MNDFLYAIADIFEALFPVFKAVGPFVNGFWIIGIFLGICGWLVWMNKHKEAPEKFD